MELARRLEHSESLFDAAYLFIGPSLGRPQHEEERLELVEEITRLPREGVSARSLGFVHFVGGGVYLDNGQRERAEELGARPRNTVGECLGV